MTTKKCILASALVLAVGFTMFARSQQNAASPNREQALARLTEISTTIANYSAEKAREVKAAFDARRTAEVVRPERICRVFMTVDYVSPGVSPHLRMDDVVLLVGPMPFSGAYQVTPVGGIGPPGWNHPWIQGHYFAVPIPLQVNTYRLHGVWVGPHNGDSEREHDYTMEITDMEDNCPSYAVFRGECHVGTPCPLDPGHAGVIR